MTETIKGSQAAIRQLVAEGVEVVLSIPDTHNLHLCDAVLDHPQLRFVTGRHEQGITFMANGYARACGKIAVPIVITGPGVTNSLTALADAYSDSVPMVLIAAQPERTRWGKGAFCARPFPRNMAVPFHVTSTSSQRRARGQSSCRPSQ